MVTEYKPKLALGCRYSYDKLENVVYLVSKEHLKKVYIDNGEAYIDDLTEVPIRLEGFNIQFTEESSLDERYKFTKQVTFSLHGYVPHTVFSGKYYVILKSKDGTKWMVNVDFPSKVTYTFNLNGSQYQTDFTFSSVSNFPTLRLASDIDEGVSPCKELKTFGIESLRLLETDYCRLDSVSGIVYTYGKEFVDVEFLGQSCSLEEQFDGEKVTTTIQFNIAFDAYKSSWHYNLLEFLQNHYSSIIEPKGSDSTFFSGFNFGLEPSFNIATTSNNGQSDIITVTLTETSSYGSSNATDWSEEEDTDTKWIYVKSVGDIQAWECVSRGVARYLLQQEVNNLGQPTGDYKAYQGHSSDFPTLNIIGEFTVERTFNNPDCSGVSCEVNTDIPNSITYTAATCYTYSYSASCDWNVSGLASYMTVTPSNGSAGQAYTLSVCNTKTPTTNESSTFSITSGDNVKIVNVNLVSESSFINPTSVTINCLAQNVTFTFNPSCPITVTSIAQSLSYNITNTQLIVQVPRNYSIESGITWSIGVKDCHNNTTTVSIIQDKTYERWVNTSDYMCDGSSSYVKQQRYTGTTSSNINTATSEYKKGAKIQDSDPRCGSSDTKWELSPYFTCVNGDKWSFEEEYKKSQGGTWQKTGNTRLKSMVESASSFCQQEVEYKWELTDRWQCYDGETPSQVKFKAEYSDSTTYSAVCDSSTELTSATTRAHSTSYAAMTSAVIGDCVTSIGDRAFYECSGLTSIVIPNSVTSIGVRTFSDCSGLTSIDIPSGVTSIGISAFWECTSLTSVAIGSGVTSIGNYAFNGCTSLASITVNATTPPTLANTNAFTNTNNCPIYVPSASVDTYKAATNWSNYADRIQAIP